MRKTLLIIFMVAALFFAACAETKPYTFENPVFPDDIDYRYCERDDDIALDGRLDEDFYRDLTALEFSAPGDAGQKMTLKAYFAEKGLLLGIARSDNAVYYTEKKPIYQNDSVEVYINPTDNKTALSADYVQFRVSAVNTTESWIGVPSSDGYPWTYYYLKFDSAVTVDGAVISAVEEDVEENRAARGYGVEIFIPWETLNLSAAPETIDIFPAFVNSTGLDSADFRWIGYGQNHVDPSAYVTFNRSGPGSREGSIFGDSRLGVYGTPGFDLSDDATVVYQRGGYDQYTFFKDLYAEKYGFSVTIGDLEILNDDPYPKVGVIAGREADRMALFLFDPFPAFDNFYGIFVPRTREDGAWGDWEWNAGIPLPAGFSYAEYNRVTALRDETDVYIFVNDEFIGKREHGFSGPTQPGLYTMNMAASYREARVLDNEEVDALIASVADSNEIFEGATPGFELTEDGAIQSGGADQWAYIKDAAGEVYGFSVAISDLVRLNNDPYPKVGVIIGQDGERILNFFFDPFPYFNNYYGLIVPGLKENDAWTAWEWPDGFPLPETADYAGTNTVTVLRAGEFVYALVNDSLVAKAEHDFAGASQAGLFTMNMAAVYSQLMIYGENDVLDRVRDIEARRAHDVFENPTPGFDLAVGERVAQTGNGIQYAYFKDIYAESYLARTTVTLGNNLAGDQFPKIGMLAGKGADGEIAFLFDPRPNKDVKDIIAVNKRAGGIWEWPGTLVWLHGLDYGRPIEMTVVRTGGTMYFFVDGTMVFRLDDIILSGPAQPGLMTMNHSGAYEESYATTDAAEIEAFLSAYRFSDEKNHGWSGEGNFTISEDEIVLGAGDYLVDEPHNFIENRSVILSGDFYLEFTVKSVTYAPMDWVWPKLSALLIRADGSRDYVSLGANSAKQNRFETYFGGWVNWRRFEGVDWQDGFTVRVERTVADGESIFRLYVNGTLMTYEDDQEIAVTNYLDDYHLGLTYNFAGGRIQDIEYGPLIK